MTRNGKIARLPKAVRAELNRRLADGEPGKRLVVWLNSLPEARAVLAAEFAGRPITENNLSEWKTGGFRDWERQQDLLATARNLAEQADELRAVAGGLTDHVALVVTARYAAALTAADDLGEGGKAKELRWLQALCADVVELRRGDHSAARLRLEQERREAEREKSDEEIFGLFERWATMPALRELLTDPRLSGAEKKRRLRAMSGEGEAPGAGSEAASPAPHPGPLPERGGEGEHEPVAQPADGNGPIEPPGAGSEAVNPTPQFGPLPEPGGEEAGRDPAPAAGRNGHGELPGAGNEAADLTAHPGPIPKRAGAGAGGGAESEAKDEAPPVGESASGGAWGDAGRLGRPGRGPEAIRLNPTESGPRFGSAPPLGLKPEGPR